MLDLQDYKAKDRHAEFPAAILSRIGMMEVGAQERREVGACLGDNEMVYIEELGNAM